MKKKRFSHGRKCVAILTSFVFGGAMCGYSETIAKIAPYKGVPTLFINGVPQSGMTDAAFLPSVEKFSSFTWAGINLYSICSDPLAGHPGVSEDTWKEDKSFDYSELDARVKMILDANPKAWIFPRLDLYAPAWWGKDNPEETIIAEKPDGTRYEFSHCKYRPAPSWASLKWREDTANGLRSLIRHVEASSYADRFIGYHLTSGTTQEWMMWGSNENEWTDYSKPNQLLFRKWLQCKYGTVEAFQKAWRNGKVTFETAEIPNYAQRENKEDGDFRSLATEQPCVDFYEYHSWHVADTIKYFAKVVKEATQHRKIVGFFYGYVLQLNNSQRLQNSGHLALQDLLDCADIDFLASPTSYAFRQLGGQGTSHFMSLTDSIKLHNKLWFNEDDIRTSIMDLPVGLYGRAPDVDGDVIQQNKELANVLTNGVANWWFDVGNIRHHYPVLIDAIKNLVDIAEVCKELDRSTVPQIAFVVDEHSLNYIKVGNQLGNHQVLSILPELNRGGATVGYYLPSDLPKLRQHKLIVMACSFAPNAEQVRALEELKSDGRTIVFFNGAGAFMNGDFSPYSISQFTSIDVHQHDEPLRSRLFTFGNTSGFCDGLAGHKAGNEAFNPQTVLIPSDSATVTLASFEDGRSAIVAKSFPGWTAIYCVSPFISAHAWRNLAAVSGTHRYIDTEDVIYANRSMVSVVAQQAGKRTIHLPSKNIVMEAITGKCIANTPVDCFDFEFEQNQTAIFLLK